jgi:hypothetical protein
MSLRDKRTCPVCRVKFEPTVIWQICDTPKCATVLRVRRFRARKRFGGDDGGGGGGGRQRRLFPKPVLVKPAKPVPMPEPTLFEIETELHATYGGAVEVGRDGSERPIRNVTGIM